VDVDFAGVCNEGITAERLAVEQVVANLACIMDLSDAHEVQVVT
jgi:hypothetical protein